MPTHNPIKDAVKQLKLIPKEKPKMVFKVFEDNQAAHQLASSQQLLVQTKCFAVKCHFSWQFVHHAKKNPKGLLTVEKKCSTDFVNANRLTK